MQNMTQSKDAFEIPVKNLSLALLLLTKCFLKQPCLNGLFRMSTLPFHRDNNSLTATLETVLWLVIKNNVKSVLKAKTCTKNVMQVTQQDMQFSLENMVHNKCCAWLKKLKVCIVYYPLFQVGQQKCVINHNISCEKLMFIKFHTVKLKPKVGYLLQMSPRHFSRTMHLFTIHKFTLF